MNIKEKIKTEFEKKFSDVKTEFVFIDDHEKNLDNSDFKKFQNAAKKHKSKSTRIEDKKVAYVIIPATGKQPRMIIYFTALPIKENKMNKLIENKLRKLIQKEIKSVLKEDESQYTTKELKKLIVKQIRLGDKYYLPVQYEKYTKDPEFQRINTILKKSNVLNDDGSMNKNHEMYLVFKKTMLKGMGFKGSELKEFMED